MLVPAGGLAAGYAKAGAAHEQQAVRCRALEMQIWSTLPAFARWAADTSQSFWCAVRAPSSCDACAAAELLAGR